MFSAEHLGAIENGKSLRDAVYTVIRQAILVGELGPDERLMEIPLAEQLGVSRTPVREAIRRLEKEQLVVIIPKCGAKVAKITGKHVEDAMEVRMALERIAVKSAALKITKERAERLYAINDAVRIALIDGKLGDITEYDRKLHELIAEFSENGVLRTSIAMIYEQTLRFMMEYARQRTNAVKMYEDHQKLIAAVAAGDEKESVRILEEHIMEESAKICEMLDNN